MIAKNCTDEIQKGTFPTESYYLIYGIKIKIQVEECDIHLKLQRLLSFYKVQSFPDLSNNDISLQVVRGSGHIPTTCVEVYTHNGYIQRCDDKNRLICTEYKPSDHSYAWSIVSDVTQKQAIGYISKEFNTLNEPEIEQFVSWLFQHLFHLVRYFCRSKDILMFHASAIELYNNKAVIIAGGSGAGKSVVTLSSVQQGSRLLCDDICPVKIDDGKFQVLPLMTKIGLLDDAKKFLNNNWLNKNEPVFTDLKGTKKYYAVSEIIPSEKIATQRNLGRILFLSAKRSAKTIIQEVQHQDALRIAIKALLWRELFFKTEVLEKQEQFSRICKMIESVPTMCVRLGPDMTDFWEQLCYFVQDN